MLSIKKKLAKKKVSFSKIDKRINIFIDINNSSDIIFGGRLLQSVSKYLYTVAEKHSGLKCINIGIDFVRFYSAVKRQDLLLCKASINNVHNSIIEVGVKLIAEDFLTLETKKIMSAYFTFKCLDENGNTTNIEAIYPETNIEKKRFLAAEKRSISRKNKIN